MYAWLILNLLNNYDKIGNIPEFSPDGINLIFKLLPLYANEVIICKFGLSVVQIQIGFVEIPEHTKTH